MKREGCRLADYYTPLPIIRASNKQQATSNNNKHVTEAKTPWLRLRLRFRPEPLAPRSPTRALSKTRILARNDLKQAQTVARAGAAGRHGPQSPSRMPQIGSKASRTRTEGPRARCGAVLGRFWRFWGCFGPLVGPAHDPPTPFAGAATGAWRIVLAQNSGFGQATGGRTWGRSLDRIRSRSRSPGLFTSVTCCCCCCLLVASYYYGERGVVIIYLFNRTKLQHGMSAYA